MTSGNVTRSESQRERERERIIQVFYSIKGTRRFDCTLRIDDAKIIRSSRASSRENQFESVAEGELANLGRNNK